MKNTITASVSFDFKGESHEPSVEIDLDDWARRSGREQLDLYAMVAQANNINPYGYELEVMEVSEMIFKQPVGKARGFYDVESQQFDFDGYRIAWLLDQMFDRFNQVSESILKQPLEKGGDVHQAMLAAYEMGLQSRSPVSVNNFANAGF